VPATADGGASVHAEAFMLRGEKVVLRALNRADLPRIWQFNNDLEVELAGGGDPPMPQSLERL